MRDAIILYLGGLYAIQWMDLLCFDFVCGISAHAADCISQAEMTEIANHLTN